MTDYLKQFPNILVAYFVKKKIKKKHSDGESVSIFNSRKLRSQSSRTGGCFLDHKKIKMMCNFEQTFD